MEYVIHKYTGGLLSQEHTGGDYALTATANGVCEGDASLVCYYFAITWLGA